MIGGHEEPTSGEILLDGQSLVGLTPDKRPTTTVFQHFALFPHRSVLENVEFGLKMHGMAKEERRRKSMESLEMVGLTQLSDRKPRALSGGQQQRVALARVLVTSPKALLLDEPLGDLDRLLQLRMRVELRNLQRQLGLMFIHVTHNQEESLSMADRIVVMNDGRIQQIGDPLTISTRPENELVAAFMGDNNILRGKVVSKDGDRLVVEEGDVQGERRRARRRSLQVGDAASLAVRAAAVTVDDERRRARDSLNRLDLRDRVRRVPRRSRQAAPHRRRRAAAREGDRRSLSRPSGGGRARRSAISWKEEDVQLLGA